MAIISVLFNGNARELSNALQAYAIAELGDTARNWFTLRLRKNETDCGDVIYIANPDLTVLKGQMVHVDVHKRVIWITAPHCNASELIYPTGE
jgi:transcriptional regulator with GAF, ATPase, and Fis domain